MNVTNAEQARGKSTQLLTSYTATLKTRDILSNNVQKEGGGGVILVAKDTHKITCVLGAVAVQNIYITPYDQWYVGFCLIGSKSNYQVYKANKC